MAALRKALLLAAPLLLSSASAVVPEPEQVALEADDECAAGAEGPQCGLSALQLRASAKTAKAESSAEGSEVAKDDLEAPPAEGDSGNFTVTFLNVTQDSTALSDDYCPSYDKVRVEGAPCSDPSNIGCDGCALYRMCSGWTQSCCNINGYLIMPGTPVIGMENINGGNARSFDYLMSCARASCGYEHCVLITNPANHRTQHQLHIHYRPFNDGGRALKSRLEHELCGTTGWRPFAMCGGAKARIYPSFPGVFSEVAAVYGNLAHVGITVWFTNACGGGLQTMVLATTHCSIEHQISMR